MSRCCVLIIDDDEEDMEILTDALQCNGVNNIHCVQSALEAFAFLANVESKEDLPRLIITDMYLPIMNGMEFITDLKQTKEFSNIPVIILSTLKAEQVHDINNRFGNTDYIKKPNSFNEYLEIAQYLNQRIVA